jgi:hypothetical protein
MKRLQFIPNDYQINGMYKSLVQSVADLEFFFIVGAIFLV